MAPAVNFDSAAGLVLAPAGRAALSTALDIGWADPRRRYRDGRVARQLLDTSREAVAQCLGTRADCVWFTGSGTAAIRAGARGLASRSRNGNEVVASAVEHSAVLAVADQLCREPALVPVDGAARLDLEAFALRTRQPGVAFAAVGYVNPEVGTVQPLEQVHELARAAGIPLLVDACAGVGRMANPLHWDVLAASAHKWGGPAGVGVLAVRPGARWAPPASWDSGQPPGFPAIPQIVAAAAALEATRATMAAATERLAGLSERLRRGVVAAAADVTLLGPGAPGERAPHIVSATVLYADGETLVDQLDRAGFAVASGSACTSDTRRPSHVLAAMGAVTHGNLRVSLAPEATAEQVDDFLAVLPAAVAAARESAGGDWQS